MQIANILCKFNLYGPKVILPACVLMALCIASVSHAQSYRYARKNNPNYDERKLSYGFLIGLHSSAYQIKYSDRFVTQDFDTVQAVFPGWSSGFSLGFIVNYRAQEFFDLRITPKVSFYENRLKYVYTFGPPNEQLVETTVVELPFLAKYKSARRGNVRMYMIGGITPGVEASGKKNIENSSTDLEIKQFNLSLEGGFGFDLYYPLFKFSPEIRFSKGIVDVLRNKDNPFGQPLQRVNTNTVSIYFLFQ
jgi:hypothetical protein